MKTGIILGIVVVLVAVGAFFFMQKHEAPIENTKRAPTTLELLQSAAFTVPETDTEVMLFEGEAFFEVAPESSAQGTVLLLKDLHTEWTNGSRKDVAGVFAVNSGGTGTFLYLILFDVTPTGLVKKSEVYLGDRITVTNVGVGELVHDPKANYRITVQTLERKEGDPYTATPSVQKMRTFYVTDQILKEVEEIKGDT